MNTSHDLPEQPAEQPAEHPAEPPAEHPAEPRAGHETPPPRPQPQPLPLPQHESAAFFQWLRGLGIRRGSSRWVGGVCSGLADKWGIDPVIVRGLAVVLTLFFGVGLFAYGVAWALLPEPDGRIHVEEVARGRWTSGMTGAGIATLVGLAGTGNDVFLGGNDGWFFWTLFWIAVVGGTVYWIIKRDKPKASSLGPDNKHQGAPGREGPGPSWHGPGWQPGGRSAASGTGTTPQEQAMPYAQQPYMPNPQLYVKHQPNPPKARLGAAASLLALGLAAIVGATVLMLDAANIVDLNGHQAGIAAAAAAITAGLAIIAAGIAGRTAGGLGAFSIIMLVLAGLLSLPAHDGDFQSFDQPVWSPVSITAAEAGRTVVFGNATLDLTKFANGPALGADVQVPLTSVASNITVKVPTNIPVTIKSELAAAQFSIDGKHDGGALTQDLTTNVNPDATGHGLVITLQGVASNINVVPVAVAAVP